VKAWRYVERQEIRDGISSRAFFTKKDGLPLLGHKNMFVMTMISTSVTLTAPASDMGKHVTSSL
jgi:hypothetical protein